MTSRVNDRGLALVEAILLGLLLMVPLIWTLGVLSYLHKGALAATAAAREAGFDAARAVNVPQAARAIDDAVARAFADHGIDPNDARVRWTVQPRLARGTMVEVEVAYPVTIAQAPLVGRVGGPSLWVRARHVARVDLYRSRE